jgi:hypothetical protein
MSFAQVLDELPGLTVEQRQILIRRALELDDPPLSQADEALIDSRLAAHHADPNSSVSFDEMKARLRAPSSMRRATTSTGSNGYERSAI